jgi:hypothetical protein
MTQAHPPGIDVTARPTFGKTLCRCVRWHRPVVAEDEAHHPIPTGAPFHGDPKQATVWLCPTVHSAVHACIRIHLHARAKDREPTVVELRPYTRFVKGLAQQAMDALGPQADIPLDP